MRCDRKYLILAFLVFIASKKFICSSGLKLNQNGGYDVILAIKNNEVVPEDVEGYVKNIETTFQSLTERLWESTNGTFHIASLDIVLPATWDFTTTGVTKLSYVTADVRISTARTSPYVENPNLCGSPGEFIELPKSFFDEPNSDKFGKDLGKVLLVEWARYRWGAYEEHGYPGNSKFPYFTKDLEAIDEEPKWVPNVCTNAEDNKLAGEYRQLDGTSCNPTSEKGMDSQCRFYPEQAGNSKVTSSLMSFPFLDSIKEFCDPSTHQQHVPTKQNLYCDYKSVFETIESSMDFKTVTTKAEEVPAIKIRKLSAHSKPALYLLLDQGLADLNSVHLIEEIVFQINLVFMTTGTGIPADTMIGAGLLPGEQNGIFLQQVVPLGFWKDNRNQIVKAIAHRNNQLQESLDFGIALQQAAAFIRASSPSDGGNILFVKTTGAKNSSTFTSEKEVELNLRRENIRLYALEIVGSNKERMNLMEIANATQGDAIAFGHDDDDESTIPDRIKDWLESTVLGKYENTPDYEHLERITISQDVVPNLQYTFQIWEKSQNLTFLLASPGKLDVAKIFAGVLTPIITIRVDFTEGRDYGANRYLYSGTWDTSPYMLHKVSFNYSGTENGHLTVLSTGDNLPEDIAVQVRTSALENTVDFGNLQNPEAPFIITAEITQNERPVFGANVTATIQLGLENIQFIKLVDSHPTLANSAGDGIYSEIVLFPKDGAYTITVTVTNENSTELDFLASRLNPPDQDFEEIEAVPFLPGATKISVFPNSTTVVNVEKFVPIIQRVRDLTSTENPDAASEIIFTFSAPRLLDPANFDTPELYRFFVSENQSLLIDLNVTGPPEGVDEAFNIESPFKPGTIISKEYYFNNTFPLYFVVVGFHGEIWSVASNIVEVWPSRAEEPSPTTEDTSEATDSTTDDTTMPASSSTQDVTESATTEDPDVGTTPDEGTTSEEPSKPTEDPGKGSSLPATSTEAELEESKPWAKTTAGIVTIILIVLVCFGAAGGGYWYVNRRRMGSRQNLFGSSEA